MSEGCSDAYKCYNCANPVKLNSNSIYLNTNLELMSAVSIRSQPAKNLAYICKVNSINPTNKKKDELRNVLLDELKKRLNISKSRKDVDDKNDTLMSDVKDILMSEEEN